MQHSHVCPLPLVLLQQCPTEEHSLLFHNYYSSNLFLWHYGGCPLGLVRDSLALHLLEFSSHIHCSVSFNLHSPHTLSLPSTCFVWFLFSFQIHSHTVTLSFSLVQHCMWMRFIIRSYFIILPAPAITLILCHILFSLYRRWKQLEVNLGVKHKAREPNSALHVISCGPWRPERHMNTFS